MKAKKFERQFDEGVDITATLDLSKTKRVQQGQRSEMPPNQELIVEEIRRYRDAKAQEYGYDVKVAVADFEKAHAVLMQRRQLSIPASGVQSAPRTPRQTY